MSEVLASLGDMFKMRNALSLNVGEFFAEIGSHSANSSDLANLSASSQTGFHKNWFLSKKSLTDGLRECLSAGTFTHINYFISQSRELKTHADFDHIAYFATAGFEQLLDLTKNKGSLNHPDLSFGI